MLFLAYTQLKEGLDLFIFLFFEIQNRMNNVNEAK